MDPTLRRTVIQFQRASQSRDPISNESRTTWANQGGQKFGQISGRFAKDKVVAGSQEASVTHDLRLSYYDLVGIANSDRVVIEDTVFEIVAIIRDFEGHGDSMVQLLETDTPAS